MLWKHRIILFHQVRAYSLGVQDINVGKQETMEPGYKCNPHLVALLTLLEISIIPGFIETSDWVDSQGKYV